MQDRAARISAVRAAADEQNLGLFINARTDLFLGQGREPAEAIGQAIERSKAYADAGASGFFVPGLQDDALIERICRESPLPVNVMVMDGLSPATRLAELGVARLSWGAIPYINAMAALGQDAKSVLS